MALSYLDLQPYANKRIEDMTYDELAALTSRHVDKDDNILPYLPGQSFEGLTTNREGRMFIGDPNNKTKRGGGFALSRGADGKIVKTAYDYDNEWNILPALAMATMPVWAPALGLGGAAASGVDAAYLSAADAAAGLAPEFGSIAAYEAGLAGTGAAGLASGAGGAAAGSAASGAAQAAGTTAATTAAEGGVMNSIANALKHPLVSVAGSIASGVMADRASKRAAEAQTAASEAAIGEQRRQYDQTRTDLAPWRDRGAQAANRLGVMMGLSGNAQDPNFNKGYLTSPQYTPTAPGPNRISQMMQVLNQRMGAK